VNDCQKLQVDKKKLTEQSHAGRPTPDVPLREFGGGRNRRAGMLIASGGRDGTVHVWQAVQAPE
jgi:hypothetical protein